MGTNFNCFGLLLSRTGAMGNILLLSSELVLAQSVFNFNQGAYAVSEADGVAVLRVLRTGTVDAAASLEYASRDGTAKAGVRYGAVAGTLLFAPDQTIQQILVPIVNDGLPQGTQTFQVLLSNPSPNAILGTRTNVLVSINDNDVGVQFVGASQDFRAAAGRAEVLLVRTEDGNQPVTVDVTSADVTAQAGVDYVAVSSKVSFASGDPVKVIPVQLLTPGGERGTRVFKLTLSNPTGTCLGRQTETRIAITHDDEGIRFETSTVAVSEDVGTAPIWVLRGTDDLTREATVTFYTLDQTALSGLDYVGVTNTLTFGPGETRKPIRLQILNDGLKEGNEFLRVELSEPSAGRRLGSPGVCFVTIVNNDPQLGFALSTVSVPRIGTLEVALTVLRGNDAELGPISVDYVTVDGTAKAGIDYEAATGTLRFEENEQVKTLHIHLLANRATGALKTFRVDLSNPAGGATLGAASASIRLNDSVVTLGPSFAPQLSVCREDGCHLLTWAGDGLVYRANTPAGPWVSMGAVKSPVALTGAEGGFFRIKNPRPVSIFVPRTYDAGAPMPLVIALHGYTGSGSDIEGYMNLKSFASSRGFLLCCPDGLDMGGGRGWNAWFDVAAEAAAYSYRWSDDVGFVTGIIEQVASQFTLDPKRVYLIGHSNGGGMAHFAAVRAADKIAAIASLAGNPAVFYPPPREPVNILQIHGTSDATVPYRESVQSSAPYSPLFPGALRLGQMWADFNGAQGRSTDLTGSLDLDSSLAGLETVVTRWTNAPAGGAVEIWSISGGSHAPSLSGNFTPAVLDWLWAHPKP